MSKLIKDVMIWLSITLILNFIFFYTPWIVLTLLVLTFDYLYSYFHFLQYSMNCAYLISFNFYLLLFLASFFSLLNFCHVSPFSILYLMPKLYTLFCLDHLSGTLGGVFLLPTSCGIIVTLTLTKNISLAHKNRK